MTCAPCHDIMTSLCPLYTHNCAPSMPFFGGAPRGPNTCFIIFRNNTKTSVGTLIFNTTATCMIACQDTVKWMCYVEYQPGRVKILFKPCKVSRRATSDIMQPHRRDATHRLTAANKQVKQAGARPATQNLLCLESICTFTYIETVIQ